MTFCRLTHLRFTRKKKPKIQTGIKIIDNNFNERANKYHSFIKYIELFANG